MGRAPRVDPFGVHASHAMMAFLLEFTEGSQRNAAARRKTNGHQDKENELPGSSGRGRAPAEDGA